MYGEINLKFYKICIYKYQNGMYNQYIPFFYWKNIMSYNQVYKLDEDDIPNVSDVLLFYKNKDSNIYNSTAAYVNTIGELHLENDMENLESIQPVYWCYKPEYQHNQLFDVVLLNADREGEDINVGVFESFPTLDQLKSYMSQHFNADVTSFEGLCANLQVLSIDDTEIVTLFVNAEFTFNVKNRSFKGSIDIHMENSILTWD